MSKKKKVSTKSVKTFFQKIIERIKKCDCKKEFLKLTPLKVTVLVFAVILILVYLLKSFIFAAFVNGRPIFRLSVISVTEKQSGKTVLDNLIEKTLIFNEAKKQGITIDKTTIDTEITNIESVLKEQNITLEEALSISKQDMNSLKEQIKIQKIVEKILGTKITISDAEITEYFTANKNYFGANTKITDVKDQIQKELFAQKLTTEYTTWIEDLKTKANIKYLVNY